MQWRITAPTAQFALHAGKRGAAQQCLVSKIPMGTIVKGISWI